MISKCCYIVIEHVVYCNDTIVMMFSYLGLGNQWDPKRLNTWRRVLPSSRKCSLLVLKGYVIFLDSLWILKGREELNCTLLVLKECMILLGFSLRLKAAGGQAQNIFFPLLFLNISVWYHQILKSYGTKWIKVEYFLTSDQ